MKFIIAHVEKYNPHAGTPRDGANACAWEFYDWSTTPVAIRLDDPRIRELWLPASKRDVKRYAKAIRQGSKPPAIVMITNGQKTSLGIVDGLHRFTAAREAGEETIDAYIGKERATPCIAPERRNHNDPLLLTSVVEYGILFETSTPVTFRFLRNTERSPNFGSRYGQDIEPAGMYLLHNPDPGDLARDWAAGTARFESPIVLTFVPYDELPYGPSGWKARLAAAFGASGKILSRRLVEAGYDAVVTVSVDKHGRAIDTREIVALIPGEQVVVDEPLRRNTSPPLVFYHASNPDSSRRIRTGDSEWDSYFFVADNPKSASPYGSRIEQVILHPDTRILYEGTRDFVHVAGRWRKGENMLTFVGRAARAARAAGYDGIWFKRQSDIGTAIFDPERSVVSRKAIVV